MRAVLCLALAVLLAGPAEARELLRNGHFTSLDGWWASPNLTLTAGRGGLCVDVPGGTTNPWDASIGQDGVKLVAGQGYRLAITVSGQPGGPVSAQLQQREAPYTPIVQKAARVTDKKEKWQLDLFAPSDLPDLQLSIQLGGNPEPWRFCLRQASLRDDVAISFGPDAGPRIAVNQLGYLPGGPKRATLITDAPDPVPFTLRDASGAEILTGTATPHGRDATSALDVQVIDFSSVNATGQGFTLTAAGVTSPPFAIAADLYARLRHDAFSFFYPMRSGIAIDGPVAGKAYARAAGHVSRPDGPGPNRGDADVPCRPAQIPPGEPASACDYTLDGTGGWYDAGDQGKYVVNGAVSVAQLLLAYESEAKAGGHGLDDGTLAIPESANGRPDALDEARWELDFLLKLIVPAGEPLAGMLHHKLQDDQWTGLPTLPADDPRPRELHAPSTAATLDFAAAAAIGARLFASIDPGYADRLLAAARTAYAAAKAHPDLVYTAGGYEDTALGDESFWAAAELFLATGDAAYLADLTASSYWTSDPYVQDGFSWQQVAPLAALDLATHADHLPADAAAHVRQALIDGASHLLALQQSDAFGQSLTPYDGAFGWGSNAQAIANAIVLAAAADQSGEAAFRTAAIEAADYILGRNGLGQSYVTGFGTRFSQNQHSRWFAHSRDQRLPRPPNGALAGGPNGHLQDPVMQARFSAKPCPSQLCYVDDIDAYSVNEIAINWNAGLAQYATWLARQR